MAQNTAPIFTLTPHIGTVKLATTAAITASDGSSTGSSPSLMYSCFATGNNGSFLQRVRFTSVGSAAATGVACVLRIYVSTVSTSEGSAAGATTSANTQLLAEISVPAIASDSNTNATTYFEVPINLPIQTGRWILVSQSAAQTANQQWQATAIGGDY